MTQEDKNLLLKDLCARIPYCVRCHIEGEDGVALRIGGYIEACNIHAFNFIIGEHKRLDFKTLEKIKPYLFPLSSMTEEQKKELKNEVCPDGTGYFNEESLICPVSHISDSIPFEFMSKIIEWLNKNHFDYRGLIERGLAINCTDLNIY